ncbi:MAG: hypothetical protein JWP44_1858 [Mucilaginibacter sp.]|nr:hypothetical protein [Mucilaginibacter sp.]
MLNKKTLVIYLVLSGITALVGLGQEKVPAEVTKWVVLESSNLRVDGSTNVNQFSCEIPACTEVDTLIVSRRIAGKEVTLSGSIDLNIQSFDCHNNMMTRDLRKTLKEKQFPKLYIKFLSLNELPDMTGTPSPITGQIEIEIAGVRKHFEVNYHISMNAQQQIQLLGERAINFSDFNLIPPKRLAGLVRAKDKLKVEFHLNMKTIK